MLKRFVLYFCISCVASILPAHAAFAFGSGISFATQTLVLRLVVVAVILGVSWLGVWLVSKCLKKTVNMHIVWSTFCSNHAQSQCAITPTPLPVELKSVLTSGSD